MNKHQVVCTIDVPLVRHTGLVCTCGEVFALDVGDYNTYTAQVAVVREHMGGSAEQRDIEGHGAVSREVTALA